MNRTSFFIAVLLLTTHCWSISACEVGVVRGGLNDFVANEQGAFSVIKNAKSIQLQDGPAILSFEKDLFGELSQKLGKSCTKIELTGAWQKIADGWSPSASFKSYDSYIKDQLDANSIESGPKHILLFVAKPLKGEAVKGLGAILKFGTFGITNLTGFYAAFDVVVVDLTNKESIGVTFRNIQLMLRTAPLAASWKEFDETKKEPDLNPVIADAFSKILAGHKDVQVLNFSKPWKEARDYALEKLVLALSK